jgi:hypothetical protein
MHASPPSSRPLPSAALPPSSASSVQHPPLRPMLRQHAQTASSASVAALPSLKRFVSTAVLDRRHAHRAAVQRQRALVNALAAADEHALATEAARAVHHDESSPSVPILRAATTALPTIQPTMSTALAAAVCVQRSWRMRQATLRLQRASPLFAPHALLDLSAVLAAMRAEPPEQLQAALAWIRLLSGAPAATATTEGGRSSTDADQDDDEDGDEHMLVQTARRLLCVRAIAEHARGFLSDATSAVAVPLQLSARRLLRFVQQLPLSSVGSVPRMTWQARAQQLWVAYGRMYAAWRRADSARFGLLLRAQADQLRAIRTATERSEAAVLLYHPLIDAHLVEVERRRAALLQRKSPVRATQPVGM